MIPGNPYVDGLLWLTPYNAFVENAAPWDSSQPTVITYAFGAENTTYPVYDPESTVDQVTTTAWQSYEKAAIVSALAQWSAVANVTFSKVPISSDPTSIDLHFLITDEANTRAYFSGEKGVQAFTTLPFDYGPNYGIHDQPYSPDYSVFNDQGYGWTKDALNPGR